MSSVNSSLAKKIAIGTLVGCGGGIALYYLLKRIRNAPDASANYSNKTIEELKVLGNQLFNQRKYHEAIEIFTRAIEIEEAGSESLKAMCFQNRAASKEKADGFTVQDCLDDYGNAIKMNGTYGKAYYRRSILLHKEQEHREALTEIFCALHLDPKLERNAASLMAAVIEELEKLDHADFNKDHTPGLPKHVRHERVYAWLNKTVVNDPLRTLVLSTKLDNGKLAEAIDLIQNLKYDDVAKIAAGETKEEHKLEALLLAAKFSAYENRLTEMENYIKAFETHLNSLIDLEQEKKNNLRSSMHIIKIENANSKDDILRKFYDAVAGDIRNVDYYAMAAFRLVVYGEAHEAMKILNTDDLEENNNLRLLRLTLGILANTDGNLDAARLHSAIMDLENFVKNMENPTPYGKTLLAKVFSTFSQADPAQELMNEVLQAEPEQSIHYFDRSCMANSSEEAIGYLKKCLAIEPYHAEANLMYASLLLNDMAIVNKETYKELSESLEKAYATFDGSPDFPIITGVFRLREILRAKHAAAIKLNLLE